MTYRELNARANRLAHHLRRLGVGPEVRVGICMERSLELLIGLLGVLKAGGAYVPLDPAYPQERLAFMLEDSRVAVLITMTGALDKQTSRQADKQTSSADSVTPSPLHPFTLSPCHLVTLSDAWSAIAHCAADNPTSTLDPSNLAYVIYTSGSTGTPKGVMNTHAGICNRLLWMQDAYRLTAADTVLQKTPFSFDVSVWEFFWPLLAGARLAIARPEGHRDAAYLAALIDEQHITTLHFVPSMLEMFLEQHDLSACRRLRRVICSGEALSFELQERFFARLDVELCNLYGPTEAAVDVSHWTCRAGGPDQRVPIGHPVANTQLHVLDRHLRLVPTWVPGELYIGGVQLARGYLGRPDLTAERFVPNPFGGVTGDGCWVTEDSDPNTQHPTPNTRLYRTGDLARYLPDGTIEYLGRLDNQVKLRGYRVELDEIGAVLRRHPTVHEAIVIVREDTPGRQQLVAYVVPVEEPRTKNQEPRGRATDGSWFSVLGSGELRTFLQTKLPDYMVPAAFVLLDALPLAPNGKVDRRALLAAQEWRAESEAQFVAPRTPVEEVLAGIWADVLRLEQVGIHDNFFALGGHSLHITQVVAQVYEIFQVKLSARSLIEAPTIAGLVALLLAGEAKPGQVENIARILMRVTAMSSEEKRTIIQRRRGPGDNT